MKWSCKNGVIPIRQEFDAVYRENLTGVWRYVQARVALYHEAQDVTSEVFVRAWRSWARFDPARGTVGAWLFRIAHHTVVDWLRAHRTRETPVAGEQVSLIKGVPMVGQYGAQPDSALLEGELTDRLAQGISTLSEREQEALALRFSAGLKVAEVSEILGLAEGATKMMIYRAIGKLKGVIARDDR